MTILVLCDLFETDDRVLVVPRPEAAKLAKKAADYCTQDYVDLFLTSAAAALEHALNASQGMQGSQI